MAEGMDDHFWCHDIQNMYTGYDSTLSFLTTGNSQIAFNAVHMTIVCKDNPMPCLDKLRRFSCTDRRVQESFREVPGQADSIDHLQPLEVPA